jgi:pimeloyl-ACP methyl ester carboxylesterase
MALMISGLCHLTIIVASLLFAESVLSDTSTASTLVSVGTHRLEISQRGIGAPAVVIDAGLFDQLDKLGPLQDRIARETQVITYNRAGYGRSEGGPLPRDARREADELKAMLEKASIPEPYLLVGHSLGALNIQVFALEYPDAVAGMVLLDPPPIPFILGQAFQDLGELAEQMTAEWQTIADSSAKSLDATEKTKATFFLMIASEHREMFGESARMVNAIATFGDIPLVVLASGKPNPAFGEVADEFQKYWIEQSRLLSGKSTLGRFILVEEASHHIYLDAQELVVKTILSVAHNDQGK